eukprot:TRINITY_DN3680_c0_g2_i1.p1 TRINITY_DN3680_c0_g2~~TRINITY_DN3680_c0_g2_i1.p1  ORF type:complete len:1418 (+),score=305.24 TRINITY_DN3680_c0_g2_i1:530-4255(+)
MQGGKGQPPEGVRQGVSPAAGPAAVPAAAQAASPAAALGSGRARPGGDSQQRRRDEDPGGAAAAATLAVVASQAVASQRAERSAMDHQFAGLAGQRPAPSPGPPPSGHGQPGRPRERDRPPAPPRRAAPLAAGARPRGEHSPSPATGALRADAGEAAQLHRRAALRGEAAAAPTAAALPAAARGADAARRQSSADQPPAGAGRRAAAAAPRLLGDGSSSDSSTVSEGPYSGWRGPRLHKDVRSREDAPHPGGTGPAAAAEPAPGAAPEQAPAAAAPLSQPPRPPPAATAPSPPPGSPGGARELPAVPPPPAAAAAPEAVAAEDAPAAAIPRRKATLRVSYQPGSAASRQAGAAGATQPPGAPPAALEPLDHTAKIKKLLAIAVSRERTLKGAPPAAPKADQEPGAAAGGGEEQAQPPLPPQRQPPDFRALNERASKREEELNAERLERWRQQQHGAPPPWHNLHDLPARVPGSPPRDGSQGDASSAVPAPGGAARSPPEAPAAAPAAQPAAPAAAADEKETPAERKTRHDLHAKHNQLLQTLFDAKRRGRLNLPPGITSQISELVGKWEASRKHGAPPPPAAAPAKRRRLSRGKASSDGYDSDSKDDPSDHQPRRAPQKVRREKPAPKRSRAQQRKRPEDEEQNGRSGAAAPSPHAPLELPGGDVRGREVLAEWGSSSSGSDGDSSSAAIIMPNERSSPSGDSSRSSTPEPPAITDRRPPGARPQAEGGDSSGSDVPPQADQVVEDGERAGRQRRRRDDPVVVFAVEQAAQQLQRVEAFCKRHAIPSRTRGLLLELGLDEAEAIAEELGGMKAGQDADAAVLDRIISGPASRPRAPRGRSSPAPAPRSKRRKRKRDQSAPPAAGPAAAAGAEEGAQWLPRPKKVVVKKVAPRRVFSEDAVRAIIGELCRVYDIQEPDFRLTPPDVFDHAKRVTSIAWSYEAAFDPCPHPLYLLTDPQYCINGRDALFDGIEVDWMQFSARYGNRVFLNPPFTQTRLWMMKALYECLLGCEVLALVRHRPPYVQVPSSADGGDWSLWNSWFWDLFDGKYWQSDGPVRFPTLFSDQLPARIDYRIVHMEPHRARSSPQVVAFVEGKVPADWDWPSNDSTPVPKRRPTLNLSKRRRTGYASVLRPGGPLPQKTPPVDTRDVEVSRRTCQWRCAACGTVRDLGEATQKQQWQRVACGKCREKTVFRVELAAAAAAPAPAGGAEAPAALRAPPVPREGAAEGAGRDAEPPDGCVWA